MPSTLSDFSHTRCLALAGTCGIRPKMTATSVLKWNEFRSPLGYLPESFAYREYYTFAEPCRRR